MKKAIVLLTMVMAVVSYLLLDNELSIVAMVILIGIGGCMTYADYEKAERKRNFEKRMRRIRKENKEVA